MACDGGEEHLESGAVEHVLAGMDFVADIATDVVIGVKDRLPTPREFRKSPFDEAGRARRPRISERPRQRAGEADSGFEPEDASKPWRPCAIARRPIPAALAACRERIPGAKASNASSNTGLTATSCPCKWVDNSVMATPCWRAMPETSSQ